MELFVHVLFVGSIFLDDITAVDTFDDLCFQVESKGRKFFLKAESKASMASWVKALEKYRSDLVQYEKYCASTSMAPSKAFLEHKITTTSCTTSTNTNNHIRRSTNQSIDYAKEVSSETPKMKIKHTRNNLADARAARKKNDDDDDDKSADLDEGNAADLVQAWSMDDENDDLM
jgi:hypothetical protein